VVPANTYGPSRPAHGCLVLDGQAQLQVVDEQAQPQVIGEQAQLKRLTYRHNSETAHMYKSMERAC
jgi:hypothetical protein